MQCCCAELDECVGYGESESEFCSGFTLIDERPLQRLYRCEHCATHWQLDVDDRSGFAIKVAQPENWPTFNDLPYRRGFFIRFHGGEGEKNCLWAKCPNRALVDMAICVDHAYPEFSASVAVDLAL